MSALRLLKILSIVIGLLLTLSAALVTFALTPSGLKAVVHLAERFVPALSVESVEGTLADMHLKGLAWQDAAADVHVETLAFTLSNLRPLERHASVGVLAASGVRVKLTGSADEAPSPESRSTGPLSLPFSVGLEAVTVKGFAFASEAASFSVDTLTLAGSAAGSQVTVSDLSVSGVRASLPESSNEPSARADEKAAPAASQAAAAELPAFSFPLAVDVKSLSVRDVDVSAGKTALALDSLSFAGQAKDSQALIRMLSVAGVRVTLPESAPAEKEVQKAAAAAPQILTDLRKLLNKPLLADLSLPKLPLTVKGEGISVKGVFLNGQELLSEGSLAFEAQPDRVSIDKLALVHPQARLSADGRIALGAHPTADLSGTLEPTAEPYSAYRLSLKGGLDAGRTVKAILTAASDKDTLTVSADVEAGAKPPRFAVNLAGSLDLTPLKPLTETEGRLADVKGTLEGSFEAYTLNLDGSLALPDLPQGAHVSVHAQGRELTVSDLTVAAGAAKSRAEAKVSGGLTEQGAALAGTVTATLADPADFGKFAAGLPPEFAKSNGKAHLAFDARTDASLSPASLQARVTDMTMTASVADKPVTVKGTGRIKGIDSFALKDLTVTAADATLTVDAALSQNTLSGSYKVSASDLGRLMPTLAGKVTGSGTIAGTLDLPQINAHLTAVNLAAFDVGAKKATLDMTVRSDKEGKTGKLVPRADVRVNAENLEAAGQRVKTLTAVFAGTQARHTLTVASDGRPLAIDARLTGGFDDKLENWTGTIETAALKTRPGTWSVKSAPALSANLTKGTVSLASHCWASSSQPMQVCLKDNLEAGSSGKAVLAVTNADAKLLEDLAVLPPEIKVSGRADATASISWTAPEAKSAEALVTLRGRNLTVQGAVGDGKKIEKVTAETTELTVRFTPEKAALAGTVELKEGGTLAASVAVADPLVKKALSGRVSVKEVDLARFSPVLSAVSPTLTAEGKVTADVSPSGTLEKPSLHGSVEVKDFAAHGAAVPVEMKPSDVVLRFDGDESTLDADLNTTQGKIIVKGKADWSDKKDPKADITVKGDEVRLSLPPYATAHVTPDVQASISLAGLKLGGSIRISKAHITIRDLPEGAVSASEDEEIVEHGQVAVRVKNPLHIESSLLIRLADEVNLSAFGLKSSLEGDVTVTQNDNALGLTGTIRLVDGTFKAYGQDLVINKGNLTFAGPVNKPMLDFEAIRNPETIEDDVTAGLRIKGPIDKAQTEVFATPAMSQANAVSYIMRGQGLETATGSDNAMLSSALLNIGLSQTGQFVAGLGERLRISELNLATDGSGDDSKLVVSGYVLPGLQVKYAMGIFDSIATLTVRYRLMARLFVEASSGTAQSLDLLYAFEF